MCENARLEVRNSEKVNNGERRYTANARWTPTVYYFFFFPPNYLRLRRFFPAGIIKL